MTGRGHALSLISLGMLACGCRLGEPTPASSPRPPVAAEGTQTSTPTRADSAEAPAGPELTAGDDAPDLLSAPVIDDEPSDPTPGEGPPLSPSLDDRSGAPLASRYASLDRASCEAELRRRRIPFDRVADARGVVAPLRLTGPLSGVIYRSSLPAAQRRTAAIEIYDCRLVLALDDFAHVLEKHDIVEVIHLSVYRPVSSRMPLKGPARRHGGALAIDAAWFKTKDGRTLSVEKDFHGRIGAKPCPAPTTASELRQIACEASAARLFNVLLTPDYNWAHRNHFHMEVTAGVRWTLVR